MDKLQAKNRIETLIRSLGRYSEKVLLVLSGQSNVTSYTKKIGPSLIFERLWKEVGIKKTIKDLLASRNFKFDVERAIFLTVLHRLFASGSDRACERWRRDYEIEGVGAVSLHHLYRAMAFLGEELREQEDATPFSPRCTKDLIEEEMFVRNRDLFTGLDLVFFDTTSIYFEGQGGETIGKREDSPISWGPGCARSTRLRMMFYPFKEVYPEGETTKDSAPLKVKEIWGVENRYSTGGLKLLV